MKNEFLNPADFVMKKGVRSKVCPDCGGHFGRVLGSIVCVGCGLELDSKGVPKTYFYANISVREEDEDGCKNSQGIPEEDGSNTE